MYKTVFFDILIKTTVENCYFYNQNVIPSSPYLEFKIQMKFPGGYTDLGNIVFNQNNTFLMQGGEKMYIEQDKIKEHNLIYGSNILIFKGLVVLDFISDDIRYGSYTNGRRYVSFHYDNEETMFGIDLPPSCGQISTPIENIWLYGLKCEISQQNADTLSFSPVIGYTLSCTNSSYGDTVDYLAIYSTLNQSYSLVNILNANNRYVGMYMSNLEQIKSNIENLGSEYEIDKDINDGLPFLKDFYWQFS